VSTMPPADAERLLTFEVESGVYALPIAEVHEVAEARRVRCVPTISRDTVGVMNWHGDALPVVSALLILEACEAADEQELAETEEEGRERAEARRAESGPLGGPHILVVSARDDETAQLGMPIDRVIGLVDGPRRRRGGGRLVVERRSVEGRVVSVLDPRRLVERATEVIGRVA
jgi:chemotaxis signal transduction protein